MATSTEPPDPVKRAAPANGQMQPEESNTEKSSWRTNLIMVTGVFYSTIVMFVRSLILAVVACESRSDFNLQPVIPLGSGLAMLGLDSSEQHDWITSMR